MNNSDFFGKSYLHLKNRYLIPLVNTKLDYSHIEYWLLKKLIVGKKVNLAYLSQDTFTVTLDKEDFYKAILSEIYCFQVKASYQYDEFVLQHVSSNWKFVTLYYYSFFSAFELLLFLHKGFLYIDEELKKYLDSVFTLTQSVPISLACGNYYFCENSLLANGQVLVNFSKSKGKGTHEDTWNKLAEITQNELMIHTDGNEEVFIRQFNKILQTYMPTFPAKTRNYFNYNPCSAFNDIKPRITFIPNVDDDFYKKFLNITCSKNDTNEHKAYVCQFCAIYISSLKEKMMSEYLLRNQNTSISKMNKKLTSFLI